jgi:integrase
VPLRSSTSDAERGERPPRHLRFPQGLDPGASPSRRAAASSVSIPAGSFSPSSRQASAPISDSARASAISAVQSATSAEARGIGEQAGEEAGVPHALRHSASTSASAWAVSA